jgi:hypothetical protein
MNEIKKVKQAILEAIDIIVDKKLDKLSFDRTYIAPITNKTRISLTKYNYEITIANNKYNIISESIHSIGERVKVKFPQNNPMNAYIEPDVVCINREEFNDILSRISSLEKNNLN